MNHPLIAVGGAAKDGEDVWLSGQEEHPPYHGECWINFDVGLALIVCGVWMCGLWVRAQDVTGAAWTVRHHRRYSALKQIRRVRPSEPLSYTQ